MILCPDLTPVIKEYENDWFIVNNRGGYYTHEPKGKQVAILVTMNRKVLLVKVKRPVINDFTWELPAGGCLPTESAIEGGVRELKEETGISVTTNQLIELDSMSICPNRYAENPYIYAAEVTEEQWDKRQAFDNEITELAWFSYDQIQQMLLANHIYVALPAVILGKLLLCPQQNIMHIARKGINKE